MTLPLIDHLDPGIAPFVEVLRHYGIETFESCEGGKGHSFPVPTIRFHGTPEEGYKAVWIARTFGPLPLKDLRRTWNFYHNELNGPIWEVTFYKKATFQQAKDFQVILTLPI